MKSSHIRPVAALAAVGLLAGLVACAPSTGGDEGEETFELRYSSTYGQNTFEEITTGWVLDQIEERTNGRVTFERFYDGSLIQTADVADALADGRIDVATMTSNTYPTQFPIWNAAIIPLADSNNVAHSKAQYELLSTSDVFAAEIEANNVHFIAFQSVPPIGVAGPSPIETVEDFKAKQIRAAGLSAQLVSALGGNPVNVTVEESYDALERGTIDAFYGAGLPYLVLSGLGDIAKFWSDNRFGAFTAKTIAFGLDTWNELPADIQDIITEIGGVDWWDYEITQIKDTITGVCDTLIENGGGVIIWSQEETDKANDLIGDSLWEIWRKQVADAGVSAEDAAAFEDALRTTSVELAKSNDFDSGLEECAERSKENVAAAG